MPEVVLVKVGQTWGSGVVISPDQGVILTCSHVIKDSHLYTGERAGEKVTTRKQHLNVVENFFKQTSIGDVARIGLNTNN